MKLMKNIMISSCCGSNYSSLITPPKHHPEVNVCVSVCLQRRKQVEASSNNLQAVRRFPLRSPWLEVLFKLISTDELHSVMCEAKLTV